MKTLRRTWAQIDLDHLEHNYRAIRAHLPTDCAFLGVMKADAYGHGAVPVSAALSELGAEYLAVSNLDEAVQIRRGGIRTPILILGYTPPECASLLAEYGISQAVFSLEYAEELNDNAAAAGVTLPIHVKLDSGMGRLGFSCKHGESDTLDAVSAVAQMPHLCPEGIFTHFAVADGGEAGGAYTAEQYARFCRTVDALAARGVHFAICHCANSAALLDYPDYHLDMVRAGIVLYGVSPSAQTQGMPPLCPVMSLRAVIAQIKDLKKGDTVSYGCTFCAPRDMRVAVVPVGYADGYLRRCSERGAYLLIRGKRAPIVGRVCMDQLMLDVTDIENVSTSDIVTVLGRDGEETVTADTLAEISGTIPYEILCSVGERVPRFYLSGGRVVQIKDNIVQD